MLLYSMVSSNDTFHFTWFLSANALKNPRFRLLLRVLRHRAKMAVPGSFPCYTAIPQIIQPLQLYAILHHTLGVQPPWNMHI